MNNYKFILIDKNDTNRINQIANLSKNYYHDFDPSEMHVIFGVEENNKIVAFSGLTCYHGFWCLLRCVVHPNHRGLGLQKLLIQKRLKFLKGKKAKHANVWIKPGNSYSLNNCIEMGFRFTREKPRMFNGEKHFKLRKYL